MNMRYGHRREIFASHQPARLVTKLCHQYNIPVTHSLVPHTPGIRGHKEEAPHSTHDSCPNPAWNWDRYIGMVRSLRMETFNEMIHTLAADLLT
jgi:hypothetical protein